VIAGVVARAGDVADLVSGSTLSASDVVLAIVVMVVAWILARLARRGMLGVLSKVEGVSPDLRDLFGRLTNYFVLLIGFGVSLTFLGAPIQPMLSAAIIVAVVAALALRGVAENFAAGVIIQTRRPMQLGDRIEALTHDGVVREMNGRSVVIETDDGRTVHLPNAKVLDSPLVNSSANAARRTEIQVHSPGIGDIDGTIEGILAAAGQAHGVLAEPAPVAVVRSIDHDSITMLVRVWHDPRPDAGAAAVSEVIRLIHATEQQHGRSATVFTPPAAAPAPPHHD
jgi:small-conductance mechanosensitive channel